MNKALILLGCVLSLVLATGYELRTVADRAFYCHAAVAQARECMFLLPVGAEDLCTTGHRTVVVTSNCADFKREVDAKGYLW